MESPIDPIEMETERENPIEAPRYLVSCQYCGTQCHDKIARDEHEILCDQNPASENYSG